MDTITLPRLGKKPPRHDVRTLQFSDYLCKNILPDPPATRDWANKLPIDLGMLANDRFGDCGFASQAHGIQVWTSESGQTVNLTDDQVLAAYSGCTGFKPDDPSTDNGVVLLDALKYWRNTGIGGHQIGGFVKVDQHNLVHLRIAINLFGGVYTGSNLPISAQDTSKPWTGAHGVLTGDNIPGSWGGHATWMSSFTPMYFTHLTWGGRQMADIQWLLDYTDECYAVLSQDWVNGQKKAPNGFDLTTLQSDLSKL